MAEGVDLIVHSFMDSLALQEEKAASTYPAHSQVREPSFREGGL